MEIASNNKPRALITGAEGFTGKYLTQTLVESGYDVFGTVFNNTVHSPNHIPLDLCDQDAVKKLVHEIQPVVVAHLGAMSFVHDNNVSKIYETNLLGTYALLDALGSLKDKKPKSVLLASSANIYGNSSCEIISEDTPPQPVNDYGVSKYAMEQMAQLWMNRLPIFIVRPFNYTGVGQKDHFLIPKIIKHFKEKSPFIELGNLDVWREFGDVRFVTKAYGDLLEQSPQGKTFNICTGQCYSLREIISLCKEITGHQIEIKVNPQFVRENEVKVLKGDNQRLMSVIGNHTPPSLRDTLSWMIKS